jgi:cytochrome c oxidase subunit 1
MQVSKSFRNIILIELLMPITLLVFGIYHGLMQVIYRSGLIHASTEFKIDYYQGLTLHGVINAVVLTTFFAVAFGHATVIYYLKKEPSKLLARISMWLMIIGTLMAAAAMFSGQASVLYTFYPPLMATPFFYLGAALLIIGSWFAYFAWVKAYREWKKENPGVKVPLAVLGTLINFTIWFVCTLAVAYEVLVLLLPWSMGLVKTVNVPLARMLFWFFGHALVYFWLLPSYIMFYTMLPKIAGGKLYSENAGRLALFIFLILSIPIGVHHQFSEPVFERGTKLFQSILTYGVAFPSFITAFTIAASLEYAGRKRGAKGLFGWMRKLPYWDKNNFLFAYLICGLILFIFGGATGIVNASYSLNAMVHNTDWLPGHFHMTVAGPVFLAILGMSIYLLSKLTGKEIKYKNFVAIVPYLWLIGILIFSTGLMWGGLIGEPRRTNLGMTYTNPENSLYNPNWVPTTMLALVGGIIMTISALLYFWAFFATAFSKKSFEPHLDFPTAEVLHEERELPILSNFRPWLVLMVIVILISYIPALTDTFKFKGPGAPAYKTDNPMPIDLNNF